MQARGDNSTSHHVLWFADLRDVLHLMCTSGALAPDTSVVIHCFPGLPAATSTPSAAAAARAAAPSSGPARPKATPRLPGAPVQMRLSGLAQSGAFAAAALELLARAARDTPAACAAALTPACARGVADLLAHAGFSVRLSFCPPDYIRA